MRNMDRWIMEFVSQYPQFKEIEANLTVNIFADIMVPEGDKNKIIAISDCSHSLNTMKVNEEPTSWTLK